MSPNPIARVLGKKKLVTVLIADDQQEIRRFLRRFLEKDGRFSVVGEAEDGQQAIAMVGEEHPDAVILDLAMPNTNGLQALPQLLEISPETKIVVFSSMAPFNGSSSEALDLGASVVLSKHTPPGKLIKAVMAAVKS